MPGTGWNALLSEWIGEIHRTTPATKNYALNEDRGGDEVYAKITFPGTVVVKSNVVKRSY